MKKLMWLECNHSKITYFRQKNYFKWYIYFFFHHELYFTTSKLLKTPIKKFLLIPKKNYWKKAIFGWNFKKIFKQVKKKKLKAQKKKKKKIFHVFLQGEQVGSKNFQKKVCRADFDVRAPYIYNTFGDFRWYYI